MKVASSFQVNVLCKKCINYVKEHGILFVSDEIQAGFARTGRYFGIEHFDVEPDLITVSKSLGAGVPISGVIGRAEIMDESNPGELGGTYLRKSSWM